jgi:hypothetical protein
MPAGCRLLCAYHTCRHLCECQSLTRGGQGRGGDVGGLQRSFPFASIAWHSSHEAGTLHQSITNEHPKSGCKMIGRTPHHFAQQKDTYSVPSEITEELCHDKYTASPPSYHGGGDSEPKRLFGSSTPSTPACGPHLILQRGQGRWRQGDLHVIPLSLSQN